MVRKAKIYSIVVATLLIAQSALVFGTRANFSKLDSTFGMFEDTVVEIEEVVVGSLVRDQQRRMLNGIRSSWLNYVNLHGDENLIATDSEGRVIYIDDLAEELAYDEVTMGIRRNGDRFDIYKNEEVILENARPKWDRAALEEVLSVVVTPHKAFGPTGDVIVFDSITGEMLADVSQDCADVPEVLVNGRRFITDNHKHPNNQNPEYSAVFMREVAMWRKDSSSTTEMTYLFSESYDFPEGVNNLRQYRLGEYEREFQEKIILPLENSGVAGSGMQITVLLGSQEREIAHNLKPALDNNRAVANTIESEVLKSQSYPVLVLLFSVLAFAVTIFAAASLVANKKK